MDTLEFGDFAFEGYGRDGAITIGVERKTLSDLINCMTDARYVDHQLPGMLRTYGESYLLIEAMIKAGDGGTLQHWAYDYRKKAPGWVDFGYTNRNGHTKKPYTYNQLDGFLWTLRRVAGVQVMRSRSMEESAILVRNLWNHAQKPIDQHSSLHKFASNNTIVDTFRQEPDLLQRVAALLPGVGWKKSLALSREFDTVSEMLLASQSRLTQVEGIGKALAERIYKSVRERVR
jgi:ERCC4-type nuclease